MSDFASQNPFTVVSSALISVTNGDGLVGTSGHPWTVTNTGTVLSPAGVGVDLPAGGFVTNTVGGYVSGYAGIYASTVVNAGVIHGRDKGSGVATKTVINSGTITAPNNAAVTGASTIINSGTIFGGASGLDGGTILNGTIGSANGLIKGRADGIYLGHGGAVVNYATIVGTSGMGIDLGNNLTNDVVVNYGTIAGNSDGMGGARAAASIVNHGLISGREGITAAYVLVNDGTIAGLNGAGIDTQHVAFNGSPTITLNNSGAVTGSIGVDAGYVGSIITNTGRIIGVQLLAGNHTIVTSSAHPSITRWF